MVCGCWWGSHDPALVLCMFTFVVYFSRDATIQMRCRATHAFARCKIDDYKQVLKFDDAIIAINKIPGRKCVCETQYHWRVVIYCVGSTHTKKQSVHERCVLVEFQRFACIYVLDIYFSIHVSVHMYIDICLLKNTFIFIFTFIFIIVFL